MYFIDITNTFPRVRSMGGIYQYDIWIIELAAE